jgi:hypothetical protein
MFKKKYLKYKKKYLDLKKNKLYGGAHNTQLKLKTWLEFSSYLNSNSDRLTMEQKSFIRDLAKGKLEKGIEFMTLEKLIEGDLNIYSQSYAGNSVFARMNFNRAFPDFIQYTKIVTEYLTNTEPTTTATTTSTTTATNKIADLSEEFSKLNM